LTPSRLFVAVGDDDTIRDVGDAVIGIVDNTVVGGVDNASERRVAGGC
jgi:hypothetical protein